MKKTELYDYNAIFLSLVPQGANKKEFFLLKSEDGMQLDNATIVELQEIFKADLSTGITSVFDLIEKSKLTEKSQKLVKGALRLLGAVDKSDQGEVVKEFIAKADLGFLKPEKQMTPEEKETAKKKAAKEEEDRQALFASKVKKSIGKMIAKESREAFDKIMKEDFGTDSATSDDPAVVVVMKENEKIQKQLDSEREIRITKEMELEASENYADLNVSKEDMAVILKDAVLNMDEKNVENLRKVFKAASAQVKEGAILKQKGSELAGGGGNAWEKIEKAAEAINKDGKMSKQEAIDKFLESDEGAEAYNNYEKEKDSK